MVLPDWIGRLQDVEQLIQKQASEEQNCLSVSKQTYSVTKNIVIFNLLNKNEEKKHFEKNYLLSCLVVQRTELL